jgi:hypothetical protein
MRRPSEQNTNAATMRATAWSAATLAAVAVVGLLEVPGMRTVWVVILVFAILAVPQSLLAARLAERRRKDK